MKTKYLSIAFWIAFSMALAASLEHIAWTFGTVERYPILGWLSAAAVDIGLATLAYSVQTRKKAHRPTLVLWLGLAGFAIISGLANFYHALSVEGSVVDAFAIGKAAVLSGTLPLMVLYLAEIISSDDATEAERLRKQAEREERKALAEQERSALKCSTCGKEYTTINALHAHQRIHANGRERVAA